MSLSRRDLIKGGLASVGIGAVAALCGTGSAEAKSKEKSETYDTIVVGGGMAGLACTVEAQEQGGKVVLLEKMGNCKGTTVFSAGSIAAVGTRYQKDYPDSVEAFYNDMMKLSLNKSDPDLLRVYAKEAGEGVEWLSDLGVPFSLWANLPYPELSRTIMAQGDRNTTGGSMLVRCLLKVIKQRNIPVHVNTKAYELITNDHMEVIGVRCMTPEGKKDYHARGGVVLTTGGFAANPEMIAKYVGDWGNRLIVRGSPYITGENITMAKQVSAYLVNLQLPYCGPITPTGHANPYLMHSGYGIQINSEGKRFVDESWLQSPKAQAIAERTPDNFSYLLIGQDADNDDMILTKFLRRFKLIGYQPFRGNTIEEVAKKAGLPVKNVLASVKEVNDAIRAGKTKELNPPYSYENPHIIDKGPFYLFAAAGGIANTLGGPKIDVHARVINTEQRPIPGLYAAGSAAGGLWYYDDIGGNQLGGGLVFGRRAARDSVARAKKA